MSLSSTRREAFLLFCVCCVLTTLNGWAAGALRIPARFLGNLPGTSGAVRDEADSLRFSQVCGGAMIAIVAGDV